MITRLINVLFSVYLLLWITSFVDSGILETEAQAAALYSKIAICSLLAGALIVPFAGYLSDKISPIYVIPTAFIFRGMVVLCFLQLSRPDTLWSYLLCTSMLVGSLFEGVSIEVLLLRKLPSDVRGVMTSLFGLFGMTGGLLFTLIGSIIYEEYGANSPFVVVGICDIAIAVVVILLACLGKLRD
mmetsp:Transcript_18423/g.13264  ORF Transcript_18423/g.13264 Transcript_18423/m.13264 type:complete len:185 (+) Transcript_18423:270-824(+)